MTSPQPRRTRRRSAPTTSLPRPVAGAGGNALKSAAPAPRTAAGGPHRQHHVTKDYGYVHKDLLMVTIFGTAVIGFIVAMSFVVQ
jgi:hypothetical protein